MTTISTLASTSVIPRVHNRTSALGRAYVWVREAILELSGNPDFRNEFDQLEELGPTFNLTVSTQEYDQSNIVPAGDVNLATLDIMIWTDPGTNQLRRQLREISYQSADRFQTLPATPNDWYRFGENIGFNPIPDNSYQVQARVLRQHPFSTPVEDTTILLPPDWDEIISWAAAMRGFAEILEYEKSREIRMMLYGDPRHPDRPGFIDGRKKRREREGWRRERSLRVVRRRYSGGAI